MVVGAVATASQVASGGYRRTAILINTIEVGSLILPPVVGIVAGAVLFRRQRANWAARDFSHKVNVGLYSFRRSKVEARPLMVVRTLSEKSLEELVENEHGRSELQTAAKRNLVGKDYMGFVHMEAASVKLWRSLLRKHVSVHSAAVTNDVHVCLCCRCDGICDNVERQHHSHPAHQAQEPTVLCTGNQP